MISYLHKHYDQSGADVDFISSNKKIGATEISMNAKTRTNSICSGLMNDTWCVWSCDWVTVCSSAPLTLLTPLSILGALVQIIDDISVQLECAVLRAARIADGSE